eukprot:6194623-Pleurochrysis_carterae.AAC.3
MRLIETIPTRKCEKAGLQHSASILQIYFLLYAIDENGAHNPSTYRARNSPCSIHNTSHTIAQLPTLAFSQKEHQRAVTTSQFRAYHAFMTSLIAT